MLNSCMVLTFSSSSFLSSSERGADGRGPAPEDCDGRARRRRILLLQRHGAAEPDVSAAAAGYTDTLLPSAAAAAAAAERHGEQP